MHLLGIFSKGSINFDQSGYFFGAVLITLLVNGLVSMFTENWKCSVSGWAVTVIVAEFISTSYELIPTIIGLGILAGLSLVISLFIIFNLWGNKLNFSNRY